jgi:hypothetical protein
MTCPEINRYEDASSVGETENAIGILSFAKLSASIARVYGLGILNVTSAMTQFASSSRKSPGNIDPVVSIVMFLRKVDGIWRWP